MKKRKIFLGVLLASAAIGLAACGGSKEPKYDDETTDTGEPALKVTYTVTFITNGGTAVNPVDVNDGDKLVAPTAPTKEEDANYTYTFAGWYKDSSLQNEFDFNTETITSAITLYAKWNQTAKQAPQPDMFLVSFSTNGGTSVAPIEVEDGAKIEAPVAPTKEATAAETYEFGGWYKDEGLQNAFDFDNDTITSAITLYAKWNATPVEYEVTFVSNGGSDVTSQTLAYGSKLSEPQAPTKEANAEYTYTFAGWYTDAALTKAYNFNSEITGALTLYAKWNETVNEYQVTFVSNGGTDVTSQSIAYGAKANEPQAPSKAGNAQYSYTFGGWYIDAACTEAYNFELQITGAITLYAKWNESVNYYEISFISNGGSAVVEQSIPYGSKAAEPSTPSKQEDENYTYSFAGWYTTSDFQEGTEYDFDTEVTGAITLYAKWNQTAKQAPQPDMFLVSFSTNGGTSVAPVEVEDGAKLVAPTAPTKAADATATYEFAGWYTDAACTIAYDFNTAVTSAFTLYAKWTSTPVEYTVTFDVNGGTVVTSQSVAYGAKASEPQAPTKAATAAETYEFVGWYKDASLQTAFNFDAETITSAITLYAKWTATPVEYTVTFDVNGGSAVNSQSIAYGQKAAEPEAPSKAATVAETYAFAGWYTDSACTQAYDFNSEVTSAFTLYAKWTATPVEYEVIFVSNGGTSVASQTVAYGSKVSEPTDPSKAATAEYTYTFAGWYTDSACTKAYNFNSEITGTLTLYAKWTQTVNEYQVAFDVNGGTSVITQSVAYGQKVAEPTAPSREATEAETYTFAGWYTDEELTQAYDFNLAVTSAFTLYAKWTATPVEYTVTFDVNGGTAVTAQTVAYGSKLEAPAAPSKAATAAETYEFVGWYKDAGLQTAFDFDNDTITSATTLYAKWNAEAREYTVTFNPNGGSPVSTQKVKYGETVETPVTPTKAADAEYTYEFMYWSTNEYYLVNFDLNTPITGDITVYACYVGHKISYQVTFDTNGGSAVDSQSIPYGDKATEPTAPTKAEDDNYTYEFVGWYKDATLQTAFDFENDTITSATTLYAKWTATAKVAPEPDKFMVSFEANGGTSVAPQQITDGGYVLEPTAPTKDADVQNTYEFAGWYTDSACTEAYDFNSAVTSAFTLYAKWTATPIEYTITFVSNGGSDVESQVLTYGSVITRPENPTKAATQAESYTFAFWCTNAELTQEFKFDKTVTGSMTLYARWIATPVEYTVTFDSNGGSAVDSQSVAYGSKLETPAAPTKAADVTATYTFAGWYTNTGLTQAYDFSSSVTGAFTLYAKWTATPVEYTVTFDTNGGSAVDSQTVAYGNKVIAPADPTKAATAAETYEFIGWYTTSACTEAYDFNSLVTGALTLYAGWDSTPVEYTVTFNTNGGSAIAPQSVAYGEKAIKPADPTKAATSSYTYEFAGWYSNSALTQAYDFDSSITSAMTIYAKWTEIAVQQNENSMSIGFGEGLTPWTQLITEAGVDEVSGGNTTLGKSVSYNGFTFASSKHRVDNSSGVYSYNSQSSTITFEVTGTTTLHVEGKWASSTAGSVYLKKSGTTVYTSPQYASNEDLSFTMELTAGTYTISSDKSIRLSKLYLVVETVTVTFNTSHGSVEPQKVTKGGTLSSLPELYEEGFVFQGWFTDAACTQAFTTSTAVNTDTTVYAGWVAYNPDNYVTVTFNTGLSNETIDPVVIDKNSKLTNVPELTLAGYRFDGWYIDSAFTTTFNANANITSSMTLYAKFVQQFTVTFKYEDNTTISSVVLDINEHIDSQDIPTPKFIYGYTFDNWYNGNTVFDFNNMAVTSNLTLVAKYTEAAQTSKVNVISSGTSFETLYAEFLQFDSATEYNAYVKLSSASNYTKIDSQLIRKYKSEDNSYNYYRVDAVGLKAGTYTLKIVPIVNNSEATSAQTEVSNLVVEAHDRSGFGFVNGSSSGAYNDDGTLKSNAQVVYVTNSNKDTVTLAGAVGVQNIISAMKAQKTISTPVAIRFLGNIEDPANMPNGDLYLDDVANLTVEGIGTDATMNGFGIVIKNSSNVEIRNLGFMNCNSKEGDDCGLQQANDHIWVHNCDFFYGDAGSDADQAKGDGALDTKKSSYVTHSYNHFWDNGKCNLQGMKDETTSNYITYHHNWYDHSDSRHPRIRTCTVHIYNNYFDGNAKYGVGVTMGSSAFVESNYFRSTATMKPMLSSMQGTDALGDGTFSGETGGIIKAYNNTFDGNASFISYQQNSTSFDAYVATSRNEQVPSTVKTVSGGTTYNNFDTDSSLMYSYTAQTPAEAKATVMAKAGRVQGGDFKWTFNNSTEDSNYAVISALKTALTSYSSKLLSVQSIGEQSSGGSTTPTGTTVADVISMIDALPTPANVVEADRTAIMAAKEAFDSLSSSDQSQVTNSSKLTQCINALPVPSSFTIDFRTYTVETGTNNVTFYNLNNLVMTATKISGQDTTNGIKFDKGKSFTITNNNSSTKTFVLTVVGNGSDKSFTVNDTTTTFNKTATTITFTIAAGGSTTITTSTGGAYVTTIDVA